MRIFMFFVMIFTSCKAHVKETETSKPESFRSKEKGSMLAVALSSDSDKNHQNYCVVWTSHQNGKSSYKLLTTSGGLTKTQIKTALRSVDRNVAWGLILLGGVSLAIPSHPVVDAVAFSVGVVSGVAFLAADAIQTRKDSKLLISKGVTEISDKKMGKTIKQISSLKSETPGTCDHLLEKQS